jgi:CHAT domain-containing protein
LSRREQCKSLLGLESSDRVVPPFNLTIAYQLYQKLLAPLEDLIANKRIIIVPSGQMSGFPFHVLVQKPPETAVPHSASEYRDVAWIVRNHAIVLLPSVASLKALRERAGDNAATKPYIAFGNPLLDGNPQFRNEAQRALLARQLQDCEQIPAGRVRTSLVARVVRDGFELFRGGFADIEALRRQAPLPETAEELCEVARQVGEGSNQVYLGARATEEVVKTLSKEGILANAGIIHFATHGLLPAEVERLARRGAEPALVLTPPTASSARSLEFDDGLLTVSEIAQLKLNADWVILSACNTAAGKTENAEALSGLARAFFYAGARALLVSNWYVDSISAVRLIVRTFVELKSEPRIGRAEALRRSMQALLEDRSDDLAAHPAYWASFVIVGEGAVP